MNPVRQEQESYSEWVMHGAKSEQLVEENPEVLVSCGFFDAPLAQHPPRGAVKHYTLLLIIINN